MGSRSLRFPLFLAWLCTLAACASLTPGSSEMVIRHENFSHSSANASLYTWALGSVNIRRALSEPSLEVELSELLLILTKKHGVALAEPGGSLITPWLHVTIIERPFNQGIDALFSIAVTLSLETGDGAPLVKSLFLDDGDASLASFQTLAAVVERPLVELLHRLKEVPTPASAGR